MTTPDKRYRYSIRKFNVGIASVAIAAFMFLGNGAVSVSANDLASNVEVLPSSTEIKETELVSSSTPLTETPAETPAQTEKDVTEETVPAIENADSLPTNESRQESLRTTESDDALAAPRKFSNKSSQKQKSCQPMLFGKKLSQQQTQALFER